MLIIVKNCQKLSKIVENFRNKQNVQTVQIVKNFPKYKKSKVVEVDVLKTTKYNTAKIFQMLFVFTGKCQNSQNLSFLIVFKVFNIF